MGSLLFYIFQSTLCLSILYFLFRLFFRTDTLFRTNRILLLAGAACCTLLPLVQYNVTTPQLWQQPISAVRNLLIPENGDGQTVSDVKTEATQAPAPALHTSMKEERNAGHLHRKPAPSFSWSKALSILYVSGAGVTLLFFSLSTWRMWRLIHRYPGHNYKKYRLIICPEKISSFSWGGTLVLSQEDYDQYAEEILLHEEMHLRYRHTLDLIGMEILIVAHWFNPAAWLLMRELREIHEYEADYGVLTHGIDATKYQLLLVKKSVGTRLYSMASGLTHSKLKNRINMMLKRRTSNRARLKLLLFVPVAAATLMVFAQPEVKKTVVQVVKPESVEQASNLKDEWELLEQFFARKKKDALEAGGYAPKANKEKGTHALFVNLKNIVMVDQEAIGTTDWNENARFIRTQLTASLKKEYQQAAKNNTPFCPELIVRYDRGTQMGAMKVYLNAVKEVYLQLRKEVTADKGVDEKGLDRIFPIIVTLPDSDKELKHYAKVSPKKDETPLPLEIRFFSDDGTAHKVLKGFTLKELEQEVRAYKAAAEDKDKMTISLKTTSDDIKMGTLMDVKEIIRRTYYGE